MRIGLTKILGAALALTVMAASAQAQMGGAPGGGGRHSTGNSSEKSKEPPKPKADDKAYSSALKGIPDKPYDPWHGIH